MGESPRPETAPEVPAPPADGPGCIVWHRRHLRTTDHPALAYATREYDTVQPAFVFDPQFYGDDALACDARKRFLHQCLADLQDQYESRGGRLTLAHGDPLTILEAFVDSGWDVVATADPAGRYGRDRDDAAAERCDVTFVDADGLVRGADDTRANWSDQVEAWFTADQETWNEDAVTLQHTATSVSVDAVETAYDVTPQKTDVPRGGTTAARRRLKHFTRHIDEYPGSISAPSDAATGASRLSAYLRFGCLSVRQVYQYVDEHAVDGRGKDMFRSRLYWNRHYNQKLEDWAGWMDTAVNPVLEGFHADTHDPALVNAWKRGETGYPMVDASMRCLQETGWLNFRMRAMCASVLCDLLQQPWRVGADWFYYHLVDADPAINYTQFQTQAGVVGTNMMRIYNPRKQVRDNDPDGEFVTRWVPELDALPVAHLAQPEKTPLHVQAECGVSIGDDYPYPVVDYERARQAILEKMDAVQDAALAALSEPEVARRASLSQRGRSGESTSERGSSAPGSGNEDDGDDDSTQSSLSSF